MPSNPPATADRAARLKSLRIDRDPAATGSGGRWLWALGVAVALGALAAGLWLWLAPAAATVRVEVARAAAGAPAAESVLDATGYVTARRSATVSAEITGKVREVLIEEGQSVTANQVLAYLDDSIPRAELALAEAQLEAARSALAETRAQLAEAQQNLLRTRELAERQLASAKDLDAAEATEATLAARLTTGEQNVTVAIRGVELRRRQLDVYAIRAPFAGVVIDKNAQPGEMISPISAGGGFTRTGICTIVDMDSLEIEVDVNEAYIHRVQAAQDVTALLDAYPDAPIPARVIAIVPAADREKATVRVRIGFLGRDARVLPDMGVKVSFLEGEAEPGAADPVGVFVSAGALKGVSDARYVFVIADSHAVRRAVRDVETNGERVRIGAGLSPGERVIVDAPATLADGAAVHVAQ
jgi:RND family efflux transporter MFP subunit